MRISLYYRGHPAACLERDAGRHRDRIALGDAARNLHQRNAGGSGLHGAPFDDAALECKHGITSAFSATAVRISASTLVPGISSPPGFSMVQMTSPTCREPSACTDTGLR